ncbi:MAG: cytochrome c oxidase subunit II [Bdellovibrionaceae bacterium]|nr:cytochrome c oxidase subunit II [Bdellovibrionales bacterium]MCB9082697.1 cytochrome c oxidase subunit II [Pseudobdellovibrionaceae bacterium]
MGSMIERASTFAADIDSVIMLIAVLGGFWFLVAQGILFYFMIRYRRSKNPTAGYIAGEKHEETKWVHWPHYAVIVCDIIIIGFAVKVWYDVKQTLPPPDSTIRVVGQQWAWKFHHPGPDNQLGTEDDIVTVDELHVAVNKTYHFKLESDDVLHSFSVPVFRLKQDAVPGRVITGWFKPTKTGEFDVQCAEMCGIAHGAMAARIFIQSEEDHHAWIQGQRPHHVQSQINDNDKSEQNSKEGAEAI